MPLYEYECVKCGFRVEVIQRVGDGPIGACTECGGEMKRLLSAPSFQFKGSGWYATDYARKGAGDQSTTNSEKSDSSKSEKSNSTGGERKTEKSSDGATKASKDAD